MLAQETVLSIKQPDIRTSYVSSGVSSVIMANEITFMLNTIRYGNFFTEGKIRVSRHNVPSNEEFKSKLYELIPEFQNISEDDIERLTYSDDEPLLDDDT